MTAVMMVAAIAAVTSLREMVVATSPQEMVTMEEARVVKAVEVDPRAAKVMVVDPRVVREVQEVKVPKECNFQISLPIVVQ